MSWGRLKSEVIGSVADAGNDGATARSIIDRLTSKGESFNVQSLRSYLSRLTQAGVLERHADAYRMRRDRSPS